MPTPNDICLKFNAIPLPVQAGEKLGIALGTLGKMPINGLRLPPAHGTCGWYLWCGEEMSEDADFFQPLHVAHLADYLPEVAHYLSLPPGYRFLVAGEYQDVWHDPQLCGS